MDFQSLKLFLHLAESQNFRHTAQQNHMSPSTLSRQIQKLEDELKQPLFLRDNRQVSLTLAGEHFLHFAEKALSDYSILQNQLNPNDQELRGELKLFCSVTAAYSHLPHILERFRRRYPHVEIKLTTGDPAQALQQVQTRQSDISLVGQPLHIPDNIDFFHIDDIQLSLIAPRIACPSTQLLQQQPINWQQIPFILPISGPVRERIDLWFKQMNIKNPQIYAQVSGHEGIVPMVALGCGIALLPDVVIDNSPMSGQVSRLKTSQQIPAFHLGVCVQRKKLKQPIIAAFWKMLESHKI